MSLHCQRGQSMVEYTVILIALIAALLAPNLRFGGPQNLGPTARPNEGLIGLDQAQRGTVMREIANKHRGYGYALSLAEIPEVDGSPANLIALANYYDSLGKYPALSVQLRAGGQQLNQINGQINSMSQLLSRLIPPQLPQPNPCQILTSPGGVLPIPGCP